MSWSGIELRAAREALGLSMVQLAGCLQNPITGGGPWRHTRISEAERGLRPVPEWVPEQVAALEQARDDLADIMNRYRCSLRFRSLRPRGAGGRDRSRVPMP